jgi:lipopolysaccharide/colanic/teichoic acid biosynthesis glycosyltransferase
MIKRTFDIAISLILLAVFSPLLILLAVLVRMDSPGPVIFKQKRIGLGGAEFWIYKFRTMVEGAEKIGPVVTAAGDTRITQAGQVMRRLKLDELPQLFNVFKGDMSMVGPRPEVPRMVAKYSAEQREILKVKPGILGANQNQHVDEESLFKQNENAEKFYEERILPQKLKTDLEYVRNRDPFKDVKLLLIGIAAVAFSSLHWRYIFESRRRSMFLVFDLCISMLSYFIAFLLRFGGHIPEAEFDTMVRMFPFIVLIRAPLFVYFGLYQTLWQYLGTQELLSIIKAVLSGSLLLPFAPFFLQFEIFPRSALVIDALVLISIIGGSRIVFKLSAEKLRNPRLGQKKNVLIIGAEDAGELLVREFIKRPSLGFKPVGFLDDNPSKHGVRIHGVKVV